MGLAGVYIPPLPPQAMGLAGVYITEEDVTALVEEVDDSGDGLIDFNEFRNTVLGFWLVLRDQEIKNIILSFSGTL